MSQPEKKQDPSTKKDVPESHELLKEKLIHKGHEKKFEVWDSKTRQLRKKDK